MLIFSCSLDVLSSILAGGFQQGKEEYRVRENILNLLMGLFLNSH